MHGQSTLDNCHVQGKDCEDIYLHMWDKTENERMKKETAFRRTHSNTHILNKRSLRGREGKDCPRPPAVKMGSSPHTKPPALGALRRAWLLPLSQSSGIIATCWSCYINLSSFNLSSFSLSLTKFQLTALKSWWYLPTEAWYCLTS